MPVLTRISFSTINPFFKLNVYCCIIKEVVCALEEYTCILTLDHVPGTVRVWDDEKQKSLQTNDEQKV